MRFTLTVDMDNAAFIDNPYELQDILSRLAARRPLRFREPADGTLVDHNGATVGTWELS